MTQWLLSLKESALVRLLRWLDGVLPRDDLLRDATYRRLWTLDPDQLLRRPGDDARAAAHRGGAAARHARRRWAC